MLRQYFEIWILDVSINLIQCILHLRQMCPKSFLCWTWTQGLRPAADLHLVSVTQPLESPWKRGTLQRLGQIDDFCFLLQGFFFQVSHAIYEWVVLDFIIYPGSVNPSTKNVHPYSTRTYGEGETFRVSAAWGLYWGSMLRTWFPRRCFGAKLLDSHATETWYLFFYDNCGIW
jgi:hypothetical protein